MAATRVYILAKELGVKSTAIVKKCQDEGLDVKNHMSSISAGLAATIHEWFSEGENITTVETTEKVDLKKEGFDPGVVPDSLYVLLPGESEFTPLTADVFAEIQQGKYRF